MYFVIATLGDIFLRKDIYASIITRISPFRKHIVEKPYIEMIVTKSWQASQDTIRGDLISMQLLQEGFAQINNIDNHMILHIWENPCSIQLLWKVLLQTKNILMTTFTIHNIMYIPIVTSFVRRYRWCFSVWDNILIYYW